MTVVAAARQQLRRGAGDRAGCHRRAPTRLAPCWTRHTAQVARGRCSMRQLRAELDDFLVGASEGQVQEAERIEQRLRGVPEGLEDDLLRDFARHARRSRDRPCRRPTTRSAACSATAALTRSWFSSRAPRRLMSAYSTRKNSFRASVRLMVGFISRAALRVAAAHRAVPRATKAIRDRTASMIASMTGFARREAPARGARWYASCAASITVSSRRASACRTSCAAPRASCARGSRAPCAAARWTAPSATAASRARPARCNWIRRRWHAWWMRCSRCRARCASPPP